MRQIFYVTTFLFFLFSSPFANSLSVKQLSLDQIISFSEYIFNGTVVDTRVEDDVYESGYLVKYYTFEVNECLKGDCDKTITFKQIVGGPGLSLPDYQVGESYLLFIPEASEETGLVAPVGIWQGRYTLKKEGDEWTIPSLEKNKHLQKRLGLSSPVQKGLTKEAQTKEKSSYELFKETILEHN